MITLDMDQNPTPHIIKFLTNQSQGANIQEISLALGLNRNLVAKYLTILHMQGRLEMRSYGKVRIYRISNRIPFHSLSLLSEHFILGIDKTLTIRDCFGCSDGLFGISNEIVPGKQISDLNNPLFFTPAILSRIRDILDGTVSLYPREEQVIGGVHAWISLIPCIFDDGTVGVAVLCSSLPLNQGQIRDIERLSTRMSTVLSEIHDFFIELSPEWQIIEINPSFLHYSGMSSEDLIGLTGLPLISSEDMELIKRSIDESKSLISSPYELRAMLNDGTIRWQEWIIYSQPELRR